MTHERSKSPSFPAQVWCYERTPFPLTKFCKQPSQSRYCYPVDPVTLCQMARSITCFSGSIDTTGRLRAKLFSVAADGVGVGALPSYLYLGSRRPGKKVKFKIDKRCEAGTDGNDPGSKRSKPL